MFCAVHGLFASANIPPRRQHYAILLTCVVYHVWIVTSVIAAQVNDWPPFLSEEKDCASQGDNFLTLPNVSTLVACVYHELVACLRSVQAARDFIKGFYGKCRWWQGEGALCRLLCCH